MKLYELESQARLLALPATAKAILLCLIAHSNRNGDGTQIFPSVERLAKETSKCVRTVQFWLRWLEEAGWIIIIYRKGGQGRPSSYLLNLDQFGWLEARPAAPRERPEQTLAQRLNYARGILKRLAADSPARRKWEQTAADLEQEIAFASAPAPSPSHSRMPAIPETPVPAMTPGNLPVVVAADQALVSFEVGSDLHEIGRLYIRFIDLQAAEVVEQYGQRVKTKKWQDYQRLLRGCREQYNAALIAAGIQASDGRSPPIDDELEMQMQEWATKAHIHKLRRDGFKIGSQAWERWNAKTEEDMEALGSLLYQIKVQVTEELPI